MVADKLVSGIRSYMEKNGFKQAHLGLSGGIDSALAAYLAAEAAGRENITCLYLPSRFSSGLSGEHAALVAARLGCPADDLIPQTVAHAALGTSMAAFLVWVDDPSSDLVENLEEAYALLGLGLRALDAA